MKFKNPVSRNIIILHKTNQQKDLWYRNVDIVKNMFLHALGAWSGLLLHNYCINAAWHGGDEPEALISTVGPSCSFFWRLQVEDPSCLWGRVVCGDTETTKQYDRLLNQMNLFYHDVTQDLRRLQPTSLQEGEVMKHLTQRGETFLYHLDGAKGGLDVRFTIFPLRCVWCTGQRWSGGVGLWWSRFLWTWCPIRLIASWWTTENGLLSPQTGKTRTELVFPNLDQYQLQTWVCVFVNAHLCRLIFNFCVLFWLWQGSESLCRISLSCPSGWGGSTWRESNPWPYELMSLRRMQSSCKKSSLCTIILWLVLCCTKCAFEGIQPVKVWK